MVGEWNADHDRWGFEAYRTSLWTDIVDMVSLVWNVPGDMRDAAEDQLNKFRSYK